MTTIAKISPLGMVALFFKEIRTEREPFTFRSGRFPAASARKIRDGSWA
jgi:hypothetical protein